jgi:hypothetical protein
MVDEVRITGASLRAMLRMVRVAQVTVRELRAVAPLDTAEVTYWTDRVRKIAGHAAQYLDPRQLSEFRCRLLGDELISEDDWDRLWPDDE